MLIHDWSTLNYHRHTGKTDQVLFSQGSDRGYELACALLADAATGAPLAPLELRLRTVDAVYSTRSPVPPRSANHLDEVLPTMRAAALQLPRRLVHVIDYEGDSVGHRRRWQRAGHTFLVRTDGTRTVRWRDRDCRLPQVVRALRREQAFGAPHRLTYHGQPATQTVAATVVVLTRPVSD